MARFIVTAQSLGMPIAYLTTAVYTTSKQHEKGPRKYKAEWSDSRSKAKVFSDRSDAIRNMELVRKHKIAPTDRADYVLVHNLEYVEL